MKEEDIVEEIKSKKLEYHMDFKSTSTLPTHRNRVQETRVAIGTRV